MDLDTVVRVLAAFYRLIGAEPEDTGLLLHGESADDVAYLYLTRGCRAAQRWMLKMGYSGWRTRSDALEWDGTDAEDGGRWALLPSDFLRAIGIVQTGGLPWGQEVIERDNGTVRNGFYIRGTELWLTRGAVASDPAYLEYHYLHRAWDGDVTIDFPMEARALIVAEAAAAAMEESWLAGDEAMEGKIGRALGRAREEARDISRATKAPRVMRRPYRLGNHY